MLKVLFFGRLREAAGAGELDLALPPQVSDARGLRDWLARDNPRLRDELQRPSVRIAVNAFVASPDQPLSGEETVAFMPLVSGG